MSLRVVKQGTFDTIQDLGRYGFQYLGINPCGAMDTIAARVANMLVGNDLPDAVVELHFPASSFLFDKDTMIALSGADFGARLNDHILPLNTPVIAGNHSLLQFTKYQSGARCYLAVRGGFNIDEWLNSFSTNLKANAGGHQGRNLRKDDELHAKNNHQYADLLRDHEVLIFPWKADVAPLYSSQNIIRICAGAEYGQLTDSSEKKLIISPYIITYQSDRMGYRMRGESLQLKHPVELVSSAVTKGTVQLLPSGQLIILMADHQTTGGYPRIAHVISADLPTLAQLQPNDTIQFQLIEHSEAERLLWEQHQYLHMLESGCRLKWREFLTNRAIG